MTAQTQPLRITLADGKAYPCSRIEARFLHEIGQKMREERIERTHRIYPLVDAGVEVTAEERIANRDRQYEAEAWEPTIHEVLNELQTFRWAIKAATLAVRDRNPDLTEDDVARLLGDTEQFSHIFEQIKDLGAQKTGDAPQPPPGTELVSDNPRNGAQAEPQTPQTRSKVSSS